MPNFPPKPEPQFPKRPPGADVPPAIGGEPTEPQAGDHTVDFVSDAEPPLDSAGPPTQSVFEAYVPPARTGSTQRPNSAKPTERDPSAREVDGHGDIDPSSLPTSAVPPRGTGDRDTVGLPASSAMRDMRLSTGDRADRSTLPAMIGPYRILGELGRGGMGAVYKAWHPKLQIAVAVKMILAGEHASRQQLDRFLTEAQAIAKLRDPGIVQIYEIGEHNGLPYFSLEYVDGGSLGAAIAKQPLTPEHAARITAELAKSVSYAHQQGVLHRDIKPANVLMTADGNPKLTDFGLAKQASIDPTAPRTEDGTVLGTLSYMPPEQASGDITRVGPAADQYSLGALLYHLLTGRPPFLAPSQAEILVQVLSQEPVAPRELQPTTPFDLETICLKAMSKEISRRYGSCAELEADLRRFLRHEPIVARPVSSWERLTRWCKRNPRLATSLATTAGSLIVALGISIWSVVMLTEKNADIESKRLAAVNAERHATETAEKNDQLRILAEQNAQAAKDNAEEADRNAREAYERAQDGRNSVGEMLRAVRELIPSTEERLAPLRQRLMRIAADRLEKLPDFVADWSLPVGLEKLRLLELQYLANLELGEPSRALKHLEEAEPVARERNRVHGTDSTRFNLMTILLYHAQARQAVNRDLTIVLAKGKEAVELLDDILANPSPEAFDIAKGSMNRLEVLTQIFPARYQYALNLRKVGRVEEALAALEPVFVRFDEAMTLLRSQPNFKVLPEEQWERQKEAFRGQLSEQDQLRILLWLATGRQDEALAGQQKIVEGARRFLQNDPTPTKTAGRAKLSQCLYLAGDVARVAGHRDEAQKLYAESLELAQKLYEEQPKLEQRRNNLNICLIRLAGALRESEPDRAKALYGDALKVAQEMVKADEQGITKHVAMALSLPFTGGHAATAELAESLLKRVEHPDAELQVDLARSYGGCCWSVGDAQAELRAQYATRAIELLTAAIASGYRDRVYLEHHPDFDPLRGDERFTKLLKP